MVATSNKLNPILCRPRSYNSLIAKRRLKLYPALHGRRVESTCEVRPLPSKKRWMWLSWKWAIPVSSTGWTLLFWFS